MIETIRKDINLMNTNQENGYMMTTYVISLSGEQEKIMVDCNIYIKILEGILDNHEKISNKYLEWSSEIAKDLSDNTIELIQSE